MEQCTFFSKVCLNRLTYLYACFMFCRHITNDVFNIKFSSVGELNKAICSIVLVNMDITNSEILILLQFITFIIEAISFTKFLEDTTYLARLGLIFKSQTCFRCFSVRQYNVLQIYIFICAMKVL